MTKISLATGWAFAAAIMLMGGQSAAAADKPAGKPERACFATRFVNNYTAVDDRTVYVRVGVKDVWRLDLFATCPNIDWTWKIALVSHGSSFICSPLDATIIAKGPLGPERCEVSKVTKLTEAEVAALPKKAKP